MAMKLAMEEAGAQPEQIEKAGKYLRMAGAKQVFNTSSVTGAGMEALLDHLGYALAAE